MARVTVYHDNIKQMIAEIQQSFERNGPIRMEVEASVTDGFSATSAMTTTFHLPRLLLWLDQQGREQPSVYVDPAAFATDEALEPAFVGNLITLLEQKRYIEVARSLEHRATPDSLITDWGKAEAQRLREHRADPVARLRYARETLMKWIFANFEGSRADVAAFAQARESSFIGSHLTDEEIISAVRYLADKNMIVADSLGSGLRLAANGIDCVTSGVPMNEYLAHPAQRRPCLQRHKSPGQHHRRRASGGKSEQFLRVQPQRGLAVGDVGCIDSASQPSARPAGSRAEGTR